MKILKIADWTVPLSGTVNGINMSFVCSVNKVVCKSLESRRGKFNDFFVLMFLNNFLADFLSPSVFFIVYFTAPNLFSSRFSIAKSLNFTSYKHRSISASSTFCSFTGGVMLDPGGADRSSK